MAHKIDMDNFDREYFLEDLLQKKILEAFFEALSMKEILAKITWPDGKTYFETIGFPKEAGTDHNECKEYSKVLLSHDAEIIAHLFIFKTGNPNIDDLSFLTKICLEKIMGFQKKILMTSGLHGKVVESSYEELKENNLKLQASEKKYRNLAENLDIEVKKKTLEIKKATAVLMQQEKLASIGSLAAGMAHEINNPLGFIMSNLKILGDYVEELASKSPDETETDYIRQDTKDILLETTEGLSRIQKIVADLKSFSAIDSPNMTLADLNTCMDSCLGIIGDLTGSRIVVTKNYGNLPKSIISPGKINQMLMAILMNSIQAIPDEGSIIIETSHIPKGKGFIKIAISDTGQGISPENINRVFDPFFTTRDVGKGMGLGLTTARETARSHGGDIVIENRPEGGIACTVIIPIKEQ